MNLTVTAQAAPNNEKTFLIHRLHRLNRLKPKNPSPLICGNLCNLWIEDLFFTLTFMAQATPNDEIQAGFRPKPAKPPDFH